jgi:hypothetical protein
MMRNRTRLPVHRSTLSALVLTPADSTDECMGAVRATSTHRLQTENMARADLTSALPSLIYRPFLNSRACKDDLQLQACDADRRRRGKKGGESHLFRPCSSSTVSALNVAIAASRCCPEPVRAGLSVFHFNLVIAMDDGLNGRTSG